VPSEPPTRPLRPGGWCDGGPHHPRGHHSNPPSHDGNIHHQRHYEPHQAVPEEAGPVTDKRVYEQALREGVNEMGMDLGEAREYAEWAVQWETGLTISGLRYRLEG
jgi:hypothetical protein